MKTLDETIIHYKECAEECQQIVAWLTELKNSREILNGLSHYFRTLTMKSIFEEGQLDLDMRGAQLQSASCHRTGTFVRLPDGQRLGGFPSDAVEGIG